MQTFDDFKDSVSSEKLVLAVVEASKRLMGWTLHSGSVYKLTNFDVAVIASLEDSGNAYTEVSDLASVTASKYYNDRENQTIYLRSTGSDNPNGRFLVVTFKLFFANAPITLPHDLSEGFDVYWEPSIKRTSAFGTEMDTINQASEAIEGSGSLSLYNESSFWLSRFDKLTFENQKVLIYSYNRNLAVADARLIFKGFIEKKAYNTQQIQFSLKDIFSQFKAPVALGNIQDLGERTLPALALAKQRMVLGRVFGHRPTNLDEVLSGYPVPGTLDVNIGSSSVVGTGTSFLAHLSPDDKLTLDSVDYTIATVTSDTALTLTEEYVSTTGNFSGAVTLKPDQPKRWMNRRWLVAGHALRTPTTLTMAGSTISRIAVESTLDMFANDYIYVGSLGTGQLVQIAQIISPTLLTLSSSLITPPAIGTVLTKSPVQNVFINDVPLVYYRDYAIDSDTGILTLSDDAEKTAAPLRQMANNLVFTNASRTVTGTSLNTLLKPGYVISCVGQVDMFEVLSVDSETQVTLRQDSNFTATNKGTYKAFILNPTNSVLSCDVLGRTNDDTPTGTLMNSAPRIVRKLLIDMGFADIIDEESFTVAEETAYQAIGMAIPTTYSDTSINTYRSVFNKINQSVFGSLVQSQDFKLSYLVVRPYKPEGALVLSESDILSFTSTSTSDKLVKTVIASYRPKEYDYTTGKASSVFQQKTSDVSTYLIKVAKQKVIDTLLVEQSDAERHANRWSLVLENSATAITLTTKLQAMSIEVGSVIDLSHRKMFERLGSSSARKLAMVESVKKSGSVVSIELVDLSNAFNRVGCYTDVTAKWSDVDEQGRMYGGFITDEYGLIDDDPESHGTNIIW